MIFGFLKKLGKYSGTDRRKEVRYSAEDEFIVDFQSSTPYLGSSRDISVHGVRFATICKLKRGTELLLNFRLPAEFPGIKKFTVKAKVVRVYQPRGTQRFRAGCSLKHADDTTREILRQFVQWLSGGKRK